MLKNKPKSLEWPASGSQKKDAQGPAARATMMDGVCWRDGKDGVPRGQMEEKVKPRCLNTVEKGGTRGSIFTSRGKGTGRQEEAMMLSGPGPLPKAMLGFVVLQLGSVSMSVA